MDKTIMKALQEPFPASDVEWRVGSTNKEKTKGMALPYITNRAIMQRLDDVFGIDGWQNTFMEWKGKGQICTISVYDKDKGIWISKQDGADDTDFEPTKGGLSDSMKRAAVQWGIGRYLYSLDIQWVPLKDGKYMASKPVLPAWALPKGSKVEEPPKQTSTEKPANSEGTITHEQANAMWLLSNKNDVICKKVLAKYKYKSSAEIKISDYEKICLEISKAAKAANDAQSGK